jgi:hypothetical protein
MVLSSSSSDKPLSNARARLMTDAACAHSVLQYIIARACLGLGPIALPQGWILTSVLGARSIAKLRAFSFDGFFGLA